MFKWVIDLANKTFTSNDAGIVNKPFDSIEKTIRGDKNCYVIKSKSSSSSGESHWSSSSTKMVVVADEVKFIGGNSAEIPTEASPG